jgi:hypothetical protein
MAKQRRTAAPKNDEVLLLVGTMKGAFILRSDKTRKKWNVEGPHLRGTAVYAMMHDGREGRKRTFAAANNTFFGSTLRASDDFGKTWSEPERHPIKFPEDSGRALAQIWQIVPGRKSDPNVLYCGVEPAALFKSTDKGDTWEADRGLMYHEHQPKWQPGAGGLCLHTIILDPDNPKRMLIAISAAGVYRTDDGGKTWQARNKGVRAEFLPDKLPEFGQCVH